MNPPLTSVGKRFGAGLAPTLLFTFSARIATAVIGLLVTPIYLHLLGREAYGLVAFWLAGQSWMFVFDLGLSPAVARQLSRFRAGALTAAEASSLLRLAERIFLTGGLVAALLFNLAVPWIATRWLRASGLPASEVIWSLRLITLLLVSRWMAGLYQTALVGLEAQRRANAVAVVGIAVRSGASVLALAILSRGPIVFFIVQGMGGLLEAVASRVLLSTAAPRGSVAGGVGRRLLVGEFRFAASLAVSSLVGAVIAQADKVTLSHTLPLAEFGLFSLVVTICSGIGMVVPPFVQAVQPRLTTLVAKDEPQAFARAYAMSLGLITALAGAIAGSIASLPEMVVFAWTGDRSLASHLAAVLALYAAGTGIASYLFAPFLLQYAHGDMRLHIIGNILFGVFWIPATVFAAVRYGPLGTGVVWLAGNVALLCLWAPVIHRRFLDKDGRRGLAIQGATSVGLMALALLLSRLLAGDLHMGRWHALAFLMALAPVVFVVGVFSSKVLRDHLKRIIQ